MATPDGITFDRGRLDEVIHRLFINAPATNLRDEDRRKSDEMAGLLLELAAAVARRTAKEELVLVDAAAGKSTVGLLAAELILAPAGRPARVTVIEREAGRVAACREALTRLRAPGVTVEIAAADVSDPSAWPAQPDVVVALHACGPASDAIIDRSVATQARSLLLVPCCTSRLVSSNELAIRQADRVGIPRHAEVRRRFIQSIVDAERTLRLEAAGWQTTVVSFVPPTVTPHNLLWRADHVGEPGRMAEAAARLARLRAVL
ncbi:MAG TPA: methyltransferase [Polyangia bacterium]